MEQLITDTLYVDTEGLTEEVIPVELSWDDYVRQEVNSLLDVFIPNSETGTVGVIYKKPVKYKTEGGEVYDEEKATAVRIILEFEFIETIDLPKNAE